MSLDEDKEEENHAAWPTAVLSKGIVNKRPGRGDTGSFIATGEGGLRLNKALGWRQQGALQGSDWDTMQKDRIEVEGLEEGTRLWMWKSPARG